MRWVCAVTLNAAWLQPWQDGALLLKTPTRYIQLLLEGESVDRSQMDIEYKTCDIRNWGEKNNIYFST
jgi:hypothetical protein